MDATSLADAEQACAPNWAGGIARARRVRLGNDEAQRGRRKAARRGGSQPQDGWLRARGLQASSAGFGVESVRMVPSRVELDPVRVAYTARLRLYIEEIASIAARVQCVSLVSVRSCEIAGVVCP